MATGGAGLLPAATGDERRVATTGPIAPPETGPIAPPGRLEALQGGPGALPGDAALPTPTDRLPQTLAGEMQPSAPAMLLPDSAARLARAPPSLMRTLDIELEPGDLGRIDMRLRLGGNALELEMRAGNAETERVLRSGRERIVALLAEAGYAIEALAIRQPAARGAYAATAGARPGRGGAPRGPGASTTAPAQNAPPTSSDEAAQ